MSEMIDIQELASQFRAHVAKLKSAHFACFMDTAFEDWFKVETLPVLESMGFQNFDPEPQIGGGRADLRVLSKGRSILFEFMSLVAGADSHKLERYPMQIDRLESEVDTDNKTTQGICFLLLSGYSDIRERYVIQKLFGERNWDTTCPSYVISIENWERMIQRIKDTIGPSNVISHSLRRMFLGSYPSQ